MSPKKPPLLKSAKATSKVQKSNAVDKKSAQKPLNAILTPQTDYKLADASFEQLFTAIPETNYKEGERALDLQVMIGQVKMSEKSNIHLSMKIRAVAVIETTRQPVFVAEVTCIGNELSPADQASREASPGVISAAEALWPFARHQLHALMGLAGHNPPLPEAFPYRPA